MNRRQFNRGLAALATAPLAPKVTMAVPAEPLHLSTPPYNWAAFVARVHNSASPQMFRRHFQLSDDMAHQVYETLVSEGVVCDLKGAVTAPFRRYPSPVKALAHVSRLGDVPKTLPQGTHSEPVDQLNHILSEDSRPVNQLGPESLDDTREDSPAPSAPDDQGSGQLA